jgi:hypothetical protein
MNDKALVAAGDLPGTDQIRVVMPALVAGIHVLETQARKDVDGRDKPGHDNRCESSECRAPSENRATQDALIHRHNFQRL